MFSNYRLHLLSHTMVQSRLESSCGSVQRESFQCQIEDTLNGHVVPYSFRNAWAWPVMINRSKAAVTF